MKNTKNTLTATLRGIEIKYGTDKFAGMIAGAYVLCLAQQNKQVDIANLEKFLKEAESDMQIRSFLVDQLKEHWDEYRKYITAFELDDLRNFIMTTSDNSPYSRTSQIPDELKDIIIQLLDIQESDYVADFGAGAGDFLCYAQNKVSAANFWGNEISTNACAIAKIRSAIIGKNKIEVVQEDMFSGTKSECMKFDKAFCFPPFGMRLGRMLNVEKFLLSQPAFPKINGTCSGEWLFALKMLSCLKENGKAVLLMPIGGLFNRLDNEIRKYFLERKMIETVIKLPGKLLNFISIPVALIVFSNKNNENVQLIDASKLDLKKLSDCVSPEKLCSLIKALTEGEFVWTSASFENTTIFSAHLNGDKIPYIAKVDYRDLIVRGNMDPTYYTKDEVIIPYADEFVAIMNDSFRGTLISASELDEIKSEKETSYLYLTPANIQDGVITEELQFLSETAVKYKRYSLQPGDLVISKNGNPFKVAIADIADGQTIIANGNLFVIRINKEKADPYYIKAFLESHKGQTLLTRASVGSTMPMISINSLREMPIALLPFEQQKEIGSKYLAKMDEIAVLKIKLAETSNQLKNIIEENLK